MTPNAPLVSVIIRTIGHPQLPRAMLSAVRQRYRMLEVVLVLARSGLAVPEIDSDVPIRTVGGEAALARAEAGNRGLDAAQGDFGIFLDEDDEWDDTHIAGLIGAHGHEPYVASYCDTRLLDREGRVKTKLGGPYKPIRLYTAGIFCIHACLFPLEAVRKLGLRFDQTLSMYEDMDFWIQLEPHLEYRYVPQCTAIWHGEDGTSGAGIGSNSRADVVTSGRRVLLDKWRERIAERAGSREELIAVGRELVQKGHLSDAIGLLKAVLLRYPAWPDALNLSGFAHLRMGEPHEAIALFRRTLEHTDHYGVRYNLALALEAVGMIDAAVIEAEKVLRQNGQFEPAQQLLKQLAER